MSRDFYTAIGLMSGTSMDGVDAALIRTDGKAGLELGAFLSRPYEPAFRDRLRALIAEGPQAPGRAAPDQDAIERELTLVHAEAVRALLHSAGMLAEAVDLIGFHGHTIHHAPHDGTTCQIGDGALLAGETGIDVVYDLRSADVAAGGEGAPLAPVFHRALLGETERPAAVLNIGGVANVTWVGEDETGRGVGPEESADLIGFDVGPGNALIDDWVRAHTGAAFDEGGVLAARGAVAEERLADLLGHEYFAAPPPKSLDRDAFQLLAAEATAGLSPQDGAALLTAFTVAGVGVAEALLPAPPRRWIVVGGGRHNNTLMRGLASHLDGTIMPGEAIGWNGDAVEAQAFAYLAVRSRLGLAISYPGTTGVPSPMSGGLFAPKACKDIIAPPGFGR